MPPSYAGQKVAMMLFLISPILTSFLWLILALLFSQLLEFNIITNTAVVASIPFTVLMGWWWIVRRASARQNKLDGLKNATRLSELGWSAQRLLVIRAIDDEASLTLALGAILNYVAARSITFALLSYFFVLIVPLTLLVVGVSWLPEGVLYRVLQVCVVFLTPMLFGMLIGSRSVHGRELAVSPMECQINTQSAPDAVGLSKIVTLIRRTYVKSLRHGIYDHEDCAKTISDWVHSLAVRVQ
jgi:hypothetical protein